MSATLHQFVLRGFVGIVAMLLCASAWATPANTDPLRASDLPRALSPATRELIAKQAVELSKDQSSTRRRAIQSYGLLEDIWAAEAEHPGVLAQSKVLQQLLRQAYRNQKSEIETANYYFGEDRKAETSPLKAGQQPIVSAFRLIESTARLGKAAHFYFSKAVGRNHRRQSRVHSRLRNGVDWALNLSYPAVLHIEQFVDESITEAEWTLASIRFSYHDGHHWALHEPHDMPWGQTLTTLEACLKHGGRILSAARGAAGEMGQDKHDLADLLRYASEGDRVVTRQGGMSLLSESGRSATRRRIKRVAVNTRRMARQLPKLPGLPSASHRFFPQFGDGRR